MSNAEAGVKLKRGKGANRKGKDGAMED